jgi:hypothetical protein
LFKNTLVGWIMKISSVLLLILIAILAGVFALPITQANGDSNLKHDKINKPPDVIRGGEWSDDFWIGQLQEAENIDVEVSHMVLKYKEQLHWIQTWTSHFASGQFWQTEAISDSVRLAWNESEQDFFTTGIYTSTVFPPGKPVDWVFSEWRYSGIPEGVVIEFRTGNTFIPDNTWTNWMIPRRENFEYICAYTYPSEKTDCFTNMSGINSSPYIQYRASFTSNSPSMTVELYDIDFLYGTHCLTGTALSILIPPVDLREWESAMITSTTPANTKLVIDILDANGTVLIPNVLNQTDLHGIDPHDYSAIQFRANFTTSNESISPDIDLWSFRWSIWNRQYLPVLHR